MRLFIHTFFAIACAIISCALLIKMIASPATMDDITAFIIVNAISALLLYTWPSTLTPEEEEARDYLKFCADQDDSCNDEYFSNIDEPDYGHHAEHFGFPDDSDWSTIRLVKLAKLVNAKPSDIISYLNLHHGYELENKPTTKISGYLHSVVIEHYAKPNHEHFPEDYDDIHQGILKDMKED